MNDKRFLFVAALAIAAGTLSADTVEKTREVTTTTVITETVVQKKESIKWSPFRVCVLDFTSPDIQGQKRFLDQHNQPIVIPPQNTLNARDHKTIDSVMQGFVRMIDAWDASYTNTANREAQIADNVFNRTKALELYKSVVQGTPRPMIIGADYLSAYLGRRNDVFSCVDASLMAAAMDKLQKEPDFPRDFMLKLAKMTGATHLIYGTVSDLRKTSSSFKGYGIETNTTNYQLDVIIKMVDLAAQHTVYSNVYTGSYREDKQFSISKIDHNIFQNLMTSALKQAAQDFYEVCKPGPKNRVTVTPLPYTVTVNPVGEALTDPAAAEIHVDGVRVGKGGSPILLPGGKHTIEVKAQGYKPASSVVEVNSDQAISITLEK